MFIKREFRIAISRSQSFQDGLQGLGVPVPFGFSVLHGSSAPASMQLSVSCDQQADN
jgi:hypothetical protein